MSDRILTNKAFVAHPLGDSHSDRQRRMLHPYVTVARERYDRVASRLAIEPRDPFLDRRVLEFCLSLPSDQIQRNGWPKYILRQSSERLVPDAVRWRRGKEHLGWDFTNAVLKDELSIQSVTNSPQVSQYAKLVANEDVNSLDTDETEFANAITLQYLSQWFSTQGRVDSEV